MFVGPDPQTGEFFVAKKGIFNKNPKVYKSVEEIEADTSGDLKNKLVTAFNELKKLPIDTILQGDMMFTTSDIETQTIDGESFYLFQPNTIAYAVATESELGKQIASANLGIVFHTKYEGDSFENLSANYSINIDSLKNASSSVWIDDANVEDYRGTATMTSNESDVVEQALSNAGKHFRKVSRGILSTISNDKALSQEIEQFQNTYIRQGVEVTDTKQHVRDLIAWYENKGDGNFGGQKIISSNLSRPWSSYTADLNDDNKPDVLKLGIIYPLPEEVIKEFLKEHKEVKILEELDNVLEKDINSLHASVQRPQPTHI